MTIHFDHDEIEALLSELETSTGRGREQVLLEALRHERERHDKILARRIAEGLKIDEEFRRRLSQRQLIDPRSIDEIIAYDDNGLPV